MTLKNDRDHYPFYQVAGVSCVYYNATFKRSWLITQVNVQSVYFLYVYLLVCFCFCLHLFKFVCIICSVWLSPLNSCLWNLHEPIDYNGMLNFVRIDCELCKKMTADSFSVSYICNRRRRSRLYKLIMAVAILLLIQIISSLRLTSERKRTFSVFFFLSFFLLCFTLRNHPSEVICPNVDLFYNKLYERHQTSLNLTSTFIHRDRQFSEIRGAEIIDFSFSSNPGWLSGYWNNIKL